MDVHTSTRERNADVSPERAREAVTEYAWGGGQYSEMNSAMRRDGEMSESAQALKKGLDAEFAKAKPTTHATTTHRMVSLDPELKRNMLETASRNGVWEEKGFVSTSRDIDVAEDFGMGSDDVRLDIEIPAGSKTINVSNYIDTSQPGHYDQKETLLPSGTRFQFTLEHPGNAGEPAVIRARMEPPGGFRHDSAPKSPAPAPKTPGMAGRPVPAPSGTYSVGPGSVRGVQAGVIKKNGWLHPVVDGKVVEDKKFRSDIKAQEEANMRANTLGYQRQLTGG